MRYGKQMDGGLISAPAILESEGLVHYHPSHEMYLAAGYLPVVDTPKPETPGVTYTNRWEEQGGCIVRVWEETTPPAPVPPTLEERVDTLENHTGELYAALTMILEGVTEDEAGAEAENSAV